MPTRKTNAVSLHRRTRTGVRRPVDTDSILDRRAHLVEELALLGGDIETPLAVNARHLLTRWWSRANWNARVQLLDTVQWLIQLERTRRAGVQPTT